MEIYLIILAALVFILIFIFIRTKPVSGGTSQELLDQLNISKAKAEERAENLRIELDYVKKQLDSEREKASETLRSIESSRSYLKAQQEKIDEQKAEIRNNQEKFNKDFELIASRILEEKTKRFTEENRNNLDIILNPFKENIKAFEEKVEKVYKAESDERNVLKGHINQLIEQSNLMNLETQNLTKALNEAEMHILNNAAEKYKTTRQIAKALGVSQPTIVRKLRKHHILTLDT